MYMYDVIMKNYQQRKTRSQKDAFIALMQERYPEIKLEKNGLFGSRNLVYGDPETADMVFTAHYDTVGLSLIPNLVTPDRPYIRILNTLLIVAPMVAAMVLTGMLMEHLGAPDSLRIITMLGVYWLLFMLSFACPRANPNTANDNTSGVLTLCSLIENLPRDLRARAAFIFFDNEEYGCIGSGAYYRAHKPAMREKPVFNMDCVGDGGTMLLVVSKKALPIYEEKLRAAFPETDDMKVRIASAKKVNYSSDQKHFPISVAAAAMKTGKWLGLYMDRIHTKKDTVCAPENIKYLTGCAAELLKNI